jgi:hypothetical protein
MREAERARVRGGGLSRLNRSGYPPWRESHASTLLHSDTHPTYRVQ